MLLNYLDLLKTKKIVLASQSARRKEIVTQMGLSDFEIYPSLFEENLKKEDFKDPIDYVRCTCQGKIDEVIQRRTKEQKDWDLMIFGDTVCVQDGKIIEKPESEDHIQEMIRNFSGRKHQVISTINILLKTKEGKVLQDTVVETTIVNFAEIPEETIVAYSKTKSGWGKAGAYGIQDMAGNFVTGIEGDFYNVVGFPMHSASQSLIKLLKQSDWVENKQQ